MFGCKCCRCSKSIESLDLSKAHTDELMINKRDKLTDIAEAKSYKKLRLSSFIPESYFVNGQQMNCSIPTTSRFDCLDNIDQTTKVKKIVPNQSSSNQETKPKLAFQPVYEGEMVNMRTLEKLIELIK